VDASGWAVVVVWEDSQDEGAILRWDNVSVEELAQQRDVRATYASQNHKAEPGHTIFAEDHSANADR